MSAVEFEAHWKADTPHAKVIEYHKVAYYRSDEVRSLLLVNRKTQSSTLTNLVGSL